MVDTKKWKARAYGCAHVHPNALVQKAFARARKHLHPCAPVCTHAKSIYARKWLPVGEDTSIGVAATHDGLIQFQALVEEAVYMKI